MRLTAKDRIGDQALFLRPNGDKNEAWPAPFIKLSEVQAVLDKLAAYEDAEEQGRLVILPCKVGDTVYWVFTLQFDEEYEVYSGKVRRITVDTLEVWVEAITRYGAIFERPIDEIGKTFFLTKAEAEAELAKIRGEKQ